jgi:hypothetical protein
MTHGPTTEYETEDPPEAPEDAPMADRWGWSIDRNPEYWHVGQVVAFREEAIQQAIDAAREENEAEDDPAGDIREVWIQQGVAAYVGSHLPNFELFSEQMIESALENGCPDEVDEPFEFSKDAAQALENALAAWADKHVRSNWFEPRRRAGAD